MNSDILSLTIEQAYKTYPFLDDFFLSCAIESPAKTDMRSLGQWIEELSISLSMKSALTGMSFLGFSKGLYFRCLKGSVEKS